MSVPTIGGRRTASSLATKTSPTRYTSMPTCTPTNHQTNHQRKKSCYNKWFRPEMATTPGTTCTKTCVLGRMRQPSITHQKGAQTYANTLFHSILIRGIKPYAKYHAVELHDRAQRVAIDQCIVLSMQLRTLIRVVTACTVADAVMGDGTCSGPPNHNHNHNTGTLKVNGYTPNQSQPQFIEDEGLHVNTRNIQCQLYVPVHSHATAEVHVK